MTRAVLLGQLAAGGPFAAVGVGHGVLGVVERVVEFELVLGVAEASGEGADDVGDGGVFGREGRQVRGDHEPGSGVKGDVGEGVVDAAAEAPAGEVHGGAAAVVQLHVFLQHRLGHERGLVVEGVIHDLADDEVGLHDVGVQRVAGERAPGEGIRHGGEVADAVGVRPREGEGAVRGLGEAEAVGAGTAAAEGGGARTVEAQVAGVHSAHGFAEGDLDFGECFQHCAGLWGDGEDGRCDVVGEGVGPRRVGGGGVEGLGGRLAIREARVGGEADGDDAVHGLREGEGVVRIRAGDAAGGCAVDEEVGGIHAIDRLGELHGDLRERIHAAGGGRAAYQGRRGGGGDEDVDGAGEVGGAEIIGGHGGEGVVAEGHVVPVEGEGRGGVVAEFHAVGVEGDIGHAAIGVAGADADRDVGRLGEGAVAGRAADGDGGRVVDDGPGVANEFEVEADVGAGEISVVNFDGDDVRPGEEEAGAGAVGEPGDAVISGGGGEGGVGGIRAEVAAENFRAIEIDDGAVVASQADGEEGERAGIGHEESAAEIVGGVFLAGVGSEAEEGGFGPAISGVAVA